MVIGGISRILSMMFLPQRAKFKAPFSNILGQDMAVALSMAVFGLVLLKLGQILQKNKVHESVKGQWCITIGCLVAVFVLTKI